MFWNPVCFNVLEPCLFQCSGTLFVPMFWNPVSSNVPEPCLFQCPGPLFVPMSRNPVCSNFLEPCLFQCSGTLFVQMFWNPLYSKIFWNPLLKTFLINSFLHLLGIITRTFVECRNINYTEKDLACTCEFVKLRNSSQYLNIKSIYGITL